MINKKIETNIIKTKEVLEIKKIYRNDDMDIKEIAESIAKTYESGLITELQAQKLFTKALRAYKTKARMQEVTKNNPDMIFDMGDNY